MKSVVLPRKELLIITAIEIMDELGLQNLSIREIAKRQGITDAALFRHFKNKNELLLDILDSYSKYDNDILESIQMKKLSPKEAICYFVTSHVTLYENDPAMTAIMQALDVLRYEPNLEEKVKTILDSRIDTIRQLIEDMKQQGAFRSDTDSEGLSVTISGLCREMCLKWRLSGRSFSLSQQTISTLNMILNAFSPNT